MLLLSVRPPRPAQHKRAASMRIGVLALIALLASGFVAVAADGPPPVTGTSEPAAPEKPAAKPDGLPSDAQSAAADSKADKQELKKEPASARYGFQRVDDGILRFDYVTGRISFCSSRPEGWGCQSVPDERGALDREIERLRGEVAELKKQMKTDEPPRPPQPIPETPKPVQPAPSASPNTGMAPSSGSPPKPDKGGDTTLAVPGQDHIARAASAVQEAWRHFLDIVTAFKNDMLRKNGA